MNAGDPRVGTVLGGYRIDARIGAGGMGVVYRAYELELRRNVALKLLAPQLVGDAGFRERFYRESRLAAAIDHPHVIPLYATGTVDDLVFIAMRYVDGEDLGDLLRRAAPMRLERALTIVGQVAGALDAAHARGLVHRDVKPANVLVGSTAVGEQSDHCYLTDFGLTKDTSELAPLTQPGTFVGTNAYVAPEQICGDTQGPATDQYALGCVLFECLTGHPPFLRGDDVAVLHAHLSEPPPQLTGERPDCPAGLDGVLATALAKAPEERHASCAAMVAAARSATSRRTVVARTVVTPVARRPDPPAPTPPEAAPPPVDGGSRRWPTWAVVAAGAAAVVAAGIGGVAAGRGGDDKSPVATAKVVSAGMSLRIPADWELAPLAPTIPGLTFEDRIAISPRDVGGRQGLVAGRVASSGPRLLPAELLSGDGRRRPDAVRLGDAQALRYAGMRPEGFSGVVTVYLLLARRGRAVIACYAASPSPRFDRRCAATAASFDLGGVRAFTVTPSASYAAAVTKVLATATRRRAVGRRRLRAARTSVAQARAAGDLATSYATAAQRARRLPVPAAAADVNAAIAAALRGLGRAHARAAVSARRRRSASYAAAREAVRRADLAVRRAVRALASLGYDVT